MVRISSIVAVGVSIIIAVYARRLSVDLLGPSGSLRSLVDGIQYGAIDGSVWATEIYVNATVWVPWIIVGGTVLTVFYVELQDQRLSRGV